MKKLFLVSLIALMTIGAVNAQEKKPETTEPAQHGPKIVFAEREHNYGTLPTLATSPLSSAASAPAAAAPLPNGPRSPLCPARPVR